MKNLAGKVALVTGGSRGIGKAIALAYAKCGMSVALTYKDAAAPARETVEQIEAGGANAIAIQVDVRDAAAIKTMVDRARHAFGRIDVLVNNAGIGHAKPWHQLTADDWHTTITTNLTSAFLASQQVAPEMVSRGWGRLIMLSSVAAQTGGVIGPHYAASKAGMIGLAHSYATLLAKTGVTSNAIAPALIETDMVSGNPNIKRDVIPVGRLGDVDEVSDIAVLLASNGYINGQTINVNGGWYMSS
ncbi:SDR family NAD(P)-dependent oxidoreductase [Paraburkholderia rhizosphaerae]|uniref:3-oxoacyl-[acyl-carrier protein] reductase n=1 Tax=Paraburkholderia rhizosphaerae TaxID=480658 RepID=A0A4R8LZN2_9BURK|nr:3-oxoacyl-ACP reductase family protein [Paraburkholderia rhizosphaerae]TDY54171.1 3-oxoacyl-[acyl-carrier protein] reductase [Paraburkholderia rhizosphaerae]